MRAIELFAGIGGFAASVSEDVEVVCSIDVSSHVLQVIERTWGHHTSQKKIETLSAETLAGFGADFWWMSPPCQPYTVRGKQQDLEDHRAASLLHLIDVFKTEHAPDTIGMENVQGFHESQARQVLLEVLSSAGYTVKEFMLCPTQLGVPAKRERYYLIATRGEFVLSDELAVPAIRSEVLEDYLDADVDESLFIDPAKVEKHGPGMRILDRAAPAAPANCFTSAYGKTFRFSGSFLREPCGRVRYFSPEEIRRLLHLPDSLSFPEEFTRRQRYKYLGNSLSVAAMRHVLRHVPGMIAG